jgi:hypothetical protein
MIKELYCENGDNDDSEYRTCGPLPIHKDALQCVSQLITYSSAHQPQFVGDPSHLFNSTEAQWIAAQMKRLKKKKE